MLRTIIEIVVALVNIAIFCAWVTGQLDPLQKKLQEILLNVMGETKMSYGLKKTMNYRVVEEENLNAVQDSVGNTVGGVFGKGGMAEGIGTGVSRGLGL